MGQGENRDALKANHDGQPFIGESYVVAIDSLDPTPLRFRTKPMSWPGGGFFGLPLLWEILRICETGKDRGAEEHLRSPTRCPPVVIHGRP